MSEWVTACVLAWTIFTPADVNAQDTADQLRAIERARLRSLVDADVATALRLHADDVELINPVGGTLSKEQYLRGYRVRRFALPRVGAGSDEGAALRQISCHSVSSALEGLR